MTLLATHDDRETSDHMRAVDIAADRSSQVLSADASSVMSVIARAASDPNTDVDKLERLLGMHERLQDREAARAYDEAMSAAQEEMRPIAADAANPQTKSKYASYAALDRAIRPIYTRHGFALSFYQGEGGPTDMVRVACRVSRNGHTERPHLDMPADGKGAKGGDVMTKTHATGAAITYGKRYLLGMIFNIAVGEDNDGNNAGPTVGLNAGQIKVIDDLLNRTGANRVKFLEYYQAEKIADIPSKHFDHAVRALNQKKAAAQ
jgi:hypothetical protein